MNDKDLEARIAEETAKIKVDSYQKTASLGGWGASGRTLWAISTIGAVTGAVIGAIAPIIPALFVTGVAMPALAVFGVSIAAFAATGLVMGLQGGLMLGRVSGATAAVAEESERRAKEWTVRQLVSQNPNAEIIPDAPKEPAPKKSFGQRLRDTYYTFCNPKVGLTMTAIGVIGGLLLGAAFVATSGGAGLIMGGMGALTGVAMPTAAALASGTATFTAIQTSTILAYSAGVGGLFGAVWNFNFPKITSEVTHFYGKLINGDYFNRTWEPPKEPAKLQERTYVPENTISAERSFSDFRSLIAKQEAERVNDLIARN